MECHISGNCLEFRYPALYNRSQVSIVSIPVPRGISSHELKRVAESLIRRAAGLASDSVQGLAHALLHIFSYFIESDASWPSSNDWPTAIFNMYCHEIIDKQNARKPDSSRMIWARMAVVLRALMRDKIIPLSQVPSPNLPSKQRSSLSEDLTLGEEYVSVPPASIEIGQVLPKQYLVDLSYVQDSDVFFEDIERELQIVSDITYEVCMDYWQDLRRGHALGLTLIESVTRDDLLNAIKMGASHRERLHPVDPDSPNCLAYFLGAVRYFFLETYELAALSFKAMRRIPFLEKLSRSAPSKKVKLVSKLRDALNAPNLSFSDLVIRGIGQLNTRDCAAATAILMHQQPRFNSGSLEKAEAYNKNGKLRVSVTDVGGENLFFTIAKNRAKARKGGVLSALASQILIDLHSITFALRLRLRQECPEVSKQLFLVASPIGIGHVGRIGEYFNLKSNSIYCRYREVLEAKKITRSTFTLSHLRNTQGILVWLKTEALIAMSSAMGNSVKTILNNYIPDWLYHRMLAKTARRVQQKIIVLATAGMKWQLNASDFSSIEQLEKFVIKSLSADQKGNVFNDLFVAAFSDLLAGKSFDGSHESSGDFYISLTPESIAALEVYVLHRSKSIFVIKDADGNPTSLELIKLYQLIRSVVHCNLDADADTDTDTAVRDLVAGMSNAQLKRIWNESRQLVVDLERLVDRIY